MFNNAYKKAVSEVEKRASAKEELQSLKNKKGYLLGARSTSERYVRETKHAVRGYQASYDRYLNAGDKNTLQEAKNRLLNQEKELKQACNELQEVEEKIERLTAQIVASKSGTNHLAVIEHQGNIETINESINNFNNLIAAQNKIIANNTAINGTVELIAEHRELLTAMAMGKNNQAEINSIEAQIEKQEASDNKANTKRGKIIKNAQSTIVGLTKKLNKVADQLKELNAVTPLLMDDYLQSVALEAASEYQKLAHKIHLSINKLKAVDSLIEKNGVRNDSGLFPDPRWEIHLPLMDGMEKIQADHAERCYMGINNITPALNETLEQVKSEIQEKGIIL